jgi:MFS family permease
MLFGLLLTLGVAVLSFGLRTFHNSYAQKAGALGILAATFLGFYFATNNWVWGLVAAVAWLFLPWLEILTRIRALRLPKEKQLRPKSPPSSDTFPALSEITREIEDEGFVYVSDAGWDWEDYRQFFRLFYREEDRAQAAVCLNEQRDFSFYYLRISSRTKDGTVWTTWNYPLSYGLKLSPAFRINRQTDLSGSLIKVIANFCGETKLILRRSNRSMKSRLRRTSRKICATKSRTTFTKAFSSKPLQAT